MIVEPFLLSIFIAIIFAPLFSWLNRCGLHEGISLTLVVVAIITVIALMGMLIGSSAQDFSNNLPLYHERLSQQFTMLVSGLESWGIEVPREEFGALFDTDRIMKFAA